MASNVSSANCSRQLRVARFCPTKSPRYPAKFLKSPERKSSITVRRASGNFSCNARVRLEPMKPAPPVIRRLGEVAGTKTRCEINKSLARKRKRVVVDLVLCEIEKVDRREKSRPKREQLLCCK